jgi:hypothetical protein
LTIIGGCVVALSEQLGAGIGTGRSLAGCSRVANVGLINATVVATGWNGPGVGAGSSAEIDSIVELIEIVAGDITAISQNGGAGIGGATVTVGRSIVNELRIVNGNVSVFAAFGGSGIGSGAFSPGSTSSVNNVTLRAGITLNVDSSATDAIVVGDGELVLNDLSIIATTTTSHMFTKIPQVVGPLDFTFLFTIPCIREEFEDRPVIEFGNLTFPFNGRWTVDVSSDDQSHKSVILDVGPIKRLVMSLPEQGQYSASARSGSITGKLVDSNGSSIFPVGPSAAYFDQVSYVPDVPPTPLPSQTPTISHLSSIPPPSTTLPHTPTSTLVPPPSPGPTAESRKNRDLVLGIVIGLAAGLLAAGLVVLAVVLIIKHRNARKLHGSLPLCEPLIAHKSGEE